MMTYFYAADGQGVACPHKHRSRVAAERCARREPYWHPMQIMQWIPPKRFGLNGRGVLLGLVNQGGRR